MKRVIFILLLLFFNCKLTKGQVIINNKPLVQSDVVIWLDKGEKMIWAVSFPFLFQINNETSNTETLISYQYIYKDLKKGSFAFLYSIDANGKLKKLNSNHKKRINPKEIQTYTLISKHIILKDTDIQKGILESYKINDFNKDSIVLGSYKDFKIKLPNITKKLLEKDSLFVKFKNLDKSKKQYTKRIKMPIKL